MDTKRILIDATYIQNDSGLQKSVALYLFRFLDNYKEKEHSTVNISILVRESIFVFFTEKYGSRFSIIKFESKRISKISFIQSVIDAFFWQKQINKINCETVYVPFVWIYNSFAINKKKISTIHDLKPIRELTTSYAKKIPCLKSFILKIFKHYFKKCLTNSSKIIAISNFVKEDVLRTFHHIEQKDIFVLYNGIKFDNLETNPIEELVNKKFILNVNTIDEFKNTETLINAFTKLQKEELYLVLVGKETDYWNKICKPLINNKVIRLNYVSNESLNWLYENAYIFVTPSKKEGLGYTPIEASVRNCPVISSKCEALPETTMNSVFYYEPADDCKALKVQIENVIDLIENDKNFKASLVCVGEMFRRRYSIDRFVDDIYKVLTE